jgi:hypothetical protein
LRSVVDLDERHPAYSWTLDTTEGNHDIQINGFALPFRIRNSISELLTTGFTLTYTTAQVRADLQTEESALCRLSSFAFCSQPRNWSIFSRSVRQGISGLWSPNIYSQRVAGHQVDLGREREAWLACKPPVAEANALWGQ